ncbi:MAG: YybH family protein, partial [Gemmatimonadota bacterium]
MLKLARPTVLLAAIGLLAACQTEPAEQTGATEIDATTEAAASDVATVRSEIEAINDRFEQALMAHDAATIASFYTDDAVALPAGAPRAEGAAAIEAMFAEWFAQAPAPESFTLTTDDLVLAESGDLAYEIGTVQIRGTSAAGETYDDPGKYLVVWESVNGEWKLAADTWSSDAPMSMEGDAGEADQAAPAEEAPVTEPQAAQPGADEPSA